MDTDADPRPGSVQLRIAALPGIPEVEAGADLGLLIGDALDAHAPLGRDGGVLHDGDVLVVTSKIVSKAEGRRIDADDREDAITAETVRVVATRVHPDGVGVTRIVENRQGLVLAAAGVDASNTPDGTVLLLPEDPDASARRIAASIRDRFGARVGVLVSDTLGRPWREGQTDVAIGAAGVLVLDDLRGSADGFGRELAVTMAATADELAAATDLVKGKASGMPVALLRGRADVVVDHLETPARALVRAGPADMFRLGTDEALALGREEGIRMGREEAARATDAAPAFRSLALRDIPRPHFLDVIAIPIPKGVTADAAEWASAIFSPRSAPRWVRLAMDVRQGAVRAIGIPPARRDVFAVRETEGDEALIAVDEVHLDFRCAVGVDATTGLVRVTTAVRLKNARGRLYFAPVRLAHPVVVRSMLLSAARRLAPGSRNGSPSAR